MVNDAGSDPIPEATANAPVCPWCSASLPAADAAVCPSCEARLVGSDGVDILGVTTVDPFVTASSSAPRKVRVLPSLFGNDESNPPPPESELPALARPDVEVRREILRLELDARLAALQAEVQLIESEGGLPVAPSPSGADEPSPAEPPAHGPSTDESSTDEAPAG
jgi:hypothetical protein